MVYVERDRGVTRLTSAPAAPPQPIDAWPVNSIYISMDSTNPASKLGGGTWSAFGGGRVLVGIDGSDANMDAPGDIGGAKTVTLTEGQIPSHVHGPGSLQTNNAGAHRHTEMASPDDGSHAGTARLGAFGTRAESSNAMVNPDGDHSHYVNIGQTSAAGGGQAHENMPPYITVYFWRRVA